MSARFGAGGRTVIAAARASVVHWLVEPAPVPGAESAAGAGSELGTAPRPVVAVAGLRHRVGVTTLARAIGCALAARAPAGACVVSSDSGASPIPLGLPAAGRLGRRLAPLVGGRVRACGRLCLVEDADAATLCAASRELAPVVLDVADPAGAAAAAGLADHVALVAGPAAEPALAVVVAESLAVTGPTPAVLLNRAGRASERWAGGSQIEIPESRLAAQLAGAGREPRGPMGAAVSELVDRWSTAP